MPRCVTKLLEAPGISLKVALLLRLENVLRRGVERTVLPRRHRRADVDLGLDLDLVRALGSPRRPAVDLRLRGRRVRRAVDPHPQVRIGLDHLERQRTRTEDARLTVATERVVNRAVA